MSEPQPQALILDDDPWIGELLRVRLEAGIPGLEVTSRTIPDTSGEFDLYFVDNKFGNLSLAAELVRDIRRDVPGALIVVLSGDLDRPELLDLVAADCDLVCEKSGSRQIATTVAEVARRLRHPRPRERRRGFRDTVRALADLV